MLIENKFKPSRYNLITKDNSSEYFLAANILTGAIIRLNNCAKDEVARIFDSKYIQLEDLNPELYSLLLYNGFIIKDSINELDILKERHWIARNGNKALGIAVGITQQCNFACTYCYQNHLPVDLSDDMQRAIVAYVSRKLTGRDVLEIVWFGGEPLMRLDIIEKLSNKLITLCEDYGCEYTAVMTTNGYLLSADTARQLIHLGVQDIQITLDGPQEIHDLRRCLRNGKGSFNVIFNNIITNADLFDRIIVRINIDKQNADSIEKLLTIMEPLKQQIMIAFRPTTSPETPDRSDIRCLPASDYWILEDKLSIIASQRGFKLAFGYPITGTSFCAGYQRNAITIDAYGDVHRCPVCVGRRHDRMGILNNNGVISSIGGLQLEWDNWTPFEDSDCIECIALPLCMGGCLWYIGKPKINSLRCFAKYRLVERMKLDANLTDLYAKFAN